MAITYGSAAGTIITSFAMNETLPSQAQQTGNNTVIVSNILSVIGNGNIGVGTLGTGDSYFNRRITIDIAGTPQERMVTSDLPGTGNTRILTVHEDWDTNPSTETIHVYYELADVEEGGAGGGISFATRTGLWTLTRILTVGNGTDVAGLSMHEGAALEQADRGVADSLLVENNGFFRVGYYSNGEAISGGIVTITAATDDEPAQTFAIGSDSAILDSLIWAQVATLSQLSPVGSKVLYDKTKLLKTTLELEIYGDTLKNSVIAGSGGATEKVLVDGYTITDGLVISDVEVLSSNLTGFTEKRLKNVTFVNVPGYVDVVFGFYVFVNVVWNAVDFNDFTFTIADSIYEDKSLDIKVQTVSGSLLENAIVTMYEDLIITGLFPLPSNTVVTDLEGEASGSFGFKEHTNISTSSYGGYALQVGRWLSLPFVAAQNAADKYDGSVVLSSDPNIIETVQATALTNGLGIAWNEDANPSEVVDFTLGSGTLLDGMIITFTPSGAVGTITSSVSGDSIAGEIHLNTRDATSISNGDTFSRTGGTAGTFSGTYTNDSKQPFSVWIDGSAKTYQQIYEYFAAVTTDTTNPFSVATYIGKLILEWCRDQQTQPLYHTGSSFRTETSYSKGLFIVNAGAGSLEYFTDDTGTQWTPPSSITLSMTVKDKTGTAISGALSYIDDDDLVPYIMNTSTDVAGLSSVTHTDGAVVGARWRVRKYGYKPYDQIIDIGIEDKNVAVTLITDPQQT